MQLSNNNLAYVAERGAGQDQRGATSRGPDRQRPGDARSETTITRVALMSAAARVQLGSGGATGSIAGNCDRTTRCWSSTGPTAPSFSGRSSAGRGAVAQAGGGVLTRARQQHLQRADHGQRGVARESATGARAGPLPGISSTMTAAIFNRADAPVYGGAMSGSAFRRAARGRGTIRAHREQYLLGRHR